MAPPIEEKKMVSLVKFMRFGIITSVGEDDFARMEWSIRDGYPRLTVYTTNKRTEDGKADFDTIITAPFDFVTLFGFFAEMRKVFASDSKTECKIDCLNNDFVNGERTKDIIVQATVGCYKDDQGKIFIYAHAKGKKELMFEIYPKKYFNHYDEQGTLVKDKHVLNKRYALSYINVIEKLMHEHVKAEHIKELKIDPPKSRVSETSNTYTAKPVAPVAEVKPTPPPPAKKEMDITDGLNLEDLM